MEHDEVRTTVASNGLAFLTSSPPPVTPSRSRVGARRLLPLILAVVVTLSGCDRPSASPAPASRPEEPSPRFRNVDTPTSYVGDASCTTCHVREAVAYGQHAMSQTFHPWTRATRIESPSDTPLHDAGTGLTYSVVEVGHQLYQVEYVTRPDGKRLHELRRRMDYVMGSGQVARTYFTSVNGRLFQLPLTWYRQHGWDFSPGYEINNARFDRLLPDRCIACHSNYPTTIPLLEGKYAALPPGIGCERCHGPGALHVKERTAKVPRDSVYDNTIVNPARLPLERRIDGCEQCHVHTAVAVLREGKNAFSYLPSQPLRDQYAFFKVAGSIDVVSHADRLRQSACFVATRRTSKPLECATCHNPHQPPPGLQTRNLPCLGCHLPASFDKRLARSASRTDHAPGADCVSCHMPRVKERTVPHGSFTEHWIRVASRGVTRSTAQRVTSAPLEPYFARDKDGPDAPVYNGMGAVVYATLANDSRVLGKAADALQRALVQDTTRAEAHFLLGVARAQLGRTGDAIRALEQSVRIDSNRPDPLRALAHAYERAGRTPASIDLLYERVLTLQPALAWIRAEHADFLQAQGRRDEAKRAYRRALTEQPGLAVAWFNLGTVLAEERRLTESSSAFQEAVHLDPQLAQALSPLLQITTTGNVVTGVSSLGSPLATLPVRTRGPRDVQLTIANGATGTSVRFLNVPARGFVRILKPDGSLIRMLSTGDGWALHWDLLSDTQNPIAGGLYRAQVLGRDAAGRPLPPQFLYFGVVRQRAE